MQTAAVTVSLAKLAYNSLIEDQKFWYNTVPNNVVKVDIKKCCTDLINYAKGDLTVYEWNNQTCNNAAINGHLDCLTMAYQLGCVWDEEVCEWAARGGHLECLMFARDHGCPWDSNMCMIAAKYGKVECLEYCHVNGCSWDEDTCAISACYGQLGSLMYAHSNGCPWNSDTYLEAAFSGNLGCLVYCHKNGCPRDWKLSRYVVAKFSLRRIVAEDFIMTERDYYFLMNFGNCEIY